jgi:hypothetical protein
VKPFRFETRRGGRSHAAFQSLRTGTIALSAIVLIFASSGGIHEVHAASRATQVVSPSESVGNEKALLNQLRPLLGRGENVGRIYYRGSCLQDANLGISFRQLDIRPAPVGESGVAAVKSILRDEKSISAEEDDSDVIRIHIGRVRGEILQIRIPTLTLSPEEQYNAWPAIWAIQNASEVQSAMHALHIRTPMHVVNMILVRPADGLPHLPKVITDATVDQILDVIAKTFHGTILYKTCAPPDQYDIDFASAG